MSEYIQLNAEIAEMSDTEIRTALKRLVVAMSKSITCALDGGDCPAREFCEKNSRPCDLVLLDFAREEEQ